MEIKWLGHSCFLIISSEGKRIVIDPYKDFLGYKLPEDLEADIVATSHEHSDHNYIDGVKGKFIHMNNVGSFCEYGIDIKGIETFHDNKNGNEKGNNIAFKFKIDGINICHLGDLGHILDQCQINALGQIDILLIPVGGGYTIDGDDAAKVVELINPKVIIPMHYRTKALGVFGLKFSKVDKFINALMIQSKEYSDLNITLDNISTFNGVAILNYK